MSQWRLYEDARALKRLLQALQERLGPQELPISAVTIEDLLRVLAGLRKRELSESQLNSHVSSFRVFFGDLARRGLLLSNPAENLHRVPDQKLPRFVPTQEAMRRLLSVPEVTTEVGVRDRAILEILYGSGLRKMELLRLQIADLDLLGRSLFIKRGKGGKDRVVPLTEEAARWVLEYLRIRPKSLSSHLFLGILSRRAFDPFAFQVHFKALWTKAGLPGQMTTHSIRHACALHLLEGGADVVSVKNLLGHSSIQTTAIYLRLTTAHLKKALARSHPRL